jgi:hypothetical protein
MYYPKSQITPNLYTNGGEFVYANTKEAYSGYYFKVSTGKYFTGRNQDDRPNIELIQFSFDGVSLDSIPSNLPPNSPYTLINDASETVYKYNQLKTTSISYLPYYSPVLPIQQDYQVGEFRRYFCKKTNEYQYIEINKDTFAKLESKDTQILWELYQPFFIDWQLTGDKQQVARVNKNSTELVIFKNKFFGLNEYLKLDFLKYYQPEVGTINSGSYINGVNQGYVLDNRNGRGNRVSHSQNDSGSIRRDNSMPR